MDLQRLNEDEYIAEMNRRLQEHEDFAQGMEFMAYPPGATGGDITGIAIAGVGYNRAYMDVTNFMHLEFEVALTERPYRGFQRQVKM